MTEDLATWLLEQIAEDEEVVRQEIGRRERWQAEQERMAQRGAVNAVVLLPFDDDGEAGDPARMLIECDAKRRMIQVAIRLADDAVRYGDEDYTGMGFRAADVLKCLAQPYAGRPGYRQEWTP